MAISNKEKLIKNIKDLIIIILFFISVSGWMRVQKKDSADAQALKSTVENNTRAMLELKEEFKDFKDFWLEQKELNGQFKEFMENEKNSKRIP